MWTTAHFWAEFEDAGMLVDCTFLLPGGRVTRTVKVGYTQPDDMPFAGTRSTQHMIEYQTADMPDLKEGDELLVNGVTFKVREASFVDPEGGSNGFFRKALLTRT